MVDARRMSWLGVYVKNTERGNGELGYYEEEDQKKNRREERRNEGSERKLEKGFIGNGWMQAATALWLPDCPALILLRRGVSVCRLGSGEYLAIALALALAAASAGGRHSCR